MIGLDWIGLDMNLKYSLRLDKFIKNNIRIWKSKLQNKIKKCISGNVLEICGDGNSTFWF